MGQISAKLLLTLSLALTARFAQAQVDPSAALLLRSSGRSPSRGNLDSSRFTVRPYEAPRTTARPPADVSSEVVKAPPVETAKSSTNVEPPKTTTTAQNTATPTAPSTPPVAAAENAKEKELPLTDQMKVLILGGDESEIEKYKKSVHPLDPRINILELSIAPSYFYNASSSNYSYRSFSTSAPGLNFSADIWISPFFGLHGDYFTSLDAQVKSDGSKDFVSADYQKSEYGIEFRKHFGLYRKAPSLTWGINFYETSMKVPFDTEDRVSTKTSGLSLSLQARLPRTLAYSDLLGIELRPRSSHSESSLLDVHSGKKVETNGLGLWYGGEFLFDRQNQIFWKLSETVERNVFSGKANTSDPHTGDTPDGVNVTNSITMFSIGYIWGK